MSKGKKKDQKSEKKKRTIVSRVNLLFKQTTAELRDLVWSSPSEVLKEENIFFEFLFFLSKLSRERARALAEGTRQLMTEEEKLQKKRNFEIESKREKKKKTKN